MKEVPIERLHELLHYNLMTGHLTWRVRVSRAMKAGMRAGGMRTTGKAKGYIFVGIDNIRGIAAHRIAWAMHHGYWPISLIDHMDGNPSNNSISNLREATFTVNRQNTSRVRSDNKIGVAGVVKTEYGTYRARLQIGNRQKCIGTFKTIEEASACYIEAKKKHHPFFVAKQPVMGQIEQPEKEAA